MTARRNKTDDTRVGQDEAHASIGRRKVLRLGGKAAAGAGVAAIVGAVNASPADATTGNMQFGASNDAAASHLLTKLVLILTA